MKATHTLQMPLFPKPIHLTDCPSWITFAVLFVGIPFGLVTTVLLSVAVVLYPMALLFGWA